MVNLVRYFLILVLYLGKTQPEATTELHAQVNDVVAVKIAVFFPGSFCSSCNDSLSVLYPCCYMLLTCRVVLPVECESSPYTPLSQARRNRPSTESNVKCYLHTLVQIKQLRCESSIHLILLCMAWHAHQQIAAVSAGHSRHQLQIASRQLSV